MSDIHEQEPAFVRRLEDKIDRLHSHITGGSEPARGIIVRLDRVEQDQERRKNWVNVATTTAVGAVVLWAIDLFRNTK